MVTSLRLAVLALAVATGVSAAANKGAEGEPCDPSKNRLNPETYNFVSPCDAKTYCNADTNKCELKGCRRDIYPFGYSDVAYANLPPLCPEGQYCPDEGSRCLPQSEVGGPCQKDRDDQCKPPPNSKELASYLNVNGSVCLNFTCYYADVNAGQACVFDNTWYRGQADDVTTFSYMVSRDNCRKTQYCDGTDSVCKPRVNRGGGCGANKECMSYNCVKSDKDARGTCGRAADEPLKPQPWVYAVIGLAIVIALVGVMIGLWMLHRRAREENQVKLQEYYNEQIAYRQSIMSMSHAKNSLLSLPANATPETARAHLTGEPADNLGLSTSNGLLPPNIRREASNAWSDDSEVLLMENRGQSKMRFRG